MKILENSFYIKAGKNDFYIKSLINKNWIRCSSEFELSEDHKVVKLSNPESSFKELKFDLREKRTRKITPFNHPRVLIHEFEALEIFTRYLIKNLTLKFWKNTKTFVFQLDYEPLGGITDVELRAIRDYLEHVGAKETYIVNPKYNSLSFEKVEQFYQQVSTKKFFKKHKLNSEFKDIFW